MEGGYIERSAVQLGNAVPVLEKGRGGYMGRTRSMGALVAALYCLPTLADDEHPGAGSGVDNWVIVMVISELFD